MSNSPLVAEWLDRLDVVEQRLRIQAENTGGGMTSADPETGEAWERGQVWGHLAEFITFWTEQVGDVIDEYEGTPIVYGRTTADPGRLAGIDAGIDVPIATLWDEVRSDLGGLRAFLAALPESWERAIGSHPVRGEVTARDIIEQTLVSHLEEHAAQLEAIT
jgi:hypothetical protein